MSKGGEPVVKIKKENKQVVILGASGHIAKNLIYYFMQQEKIDLILYTHSSEKVYEFINRNCQTFNFKGTIDITDKFQSWVEYDVIINCIGVGTNIKNLSDYFIVTERYDNMILFYLESYPDCLYINFSSGAVYNETPVSNTSKTTLYPDDIKVSDYYTIAKLNQEAKHRSFKKLQIIDLRVFSFFSRFADLEKDNYFINQIVNSVMNKRILYTDTNEFYRDFIHPLDLFNIVLGCMRTKGLNRSLNVRSTRFTSKTNILDFFCRQYGLNITYCSEQQESLTGNKKFYYAIEDSKYMNYIHRSKFSAMEAIINEAEFFLEERD
jgi:nucleoside-diphosphate-sugar epimerase